MNIEEATKEFDSLYGPYFSYEEMACQCNNCEDHRVVSGDRGDWFRAFEFRAFMEKLIALRKWLGFPLPVNSGYRCPWYNDSLYGGKGTHLNGPHTKGAADVKCSFERSYDLQLAAMERGMGVGPTQHGPIGSRFLHLDNLGRRLWTYP